MISQTTPKDQKYKNKPLPPLLHYSHTEIKKLYTFTQQPTASKPNGLWVTTIGRNSWPDYLTNNTARQVGDFCYSVTLKPTARLLRITTHYELMAFTRKYGLTLEAAYCNGKKLTTLERKNLTDEDLQKSRVVNWQKFTARYAGILIIPYLGRPRLAPWYYGWDCSSGCIWNAEAIEGISLLPSVPDRIKAPPRRKPRRKPRPLAPADLTDHAILHGSLVQHESLGGFYPADFPAAAENE
jgi:hypothetical protein